MQTAKVKNYVKHGNVLYLQVRQHRPVVVRRRLVWRPLNAVQRWLESGDKPSAKVFAYVLLAVVAVFLVVQVVRWIIGF